VACVCLSHNAAPGSSAEDSTETSATQEPSRWGTRCRRVGAVTVTSLQDQLVRFRLTGPVSGEILHEVLQVADVESPEKSTAPPKKTKSKAGLSIAAIAVVVILCAALGLFAMFALRTKDIIGTVTAVRWERSIPIMAYAPMEYENWQDQIPQEVCHHMVHR